MGHGDTVSKKLYIREHSTNIRRWIPKSYNTPKFYIEDPIVPLEPSLARSIVVMICRNKQRTLQQAWNYWTKNTDIVHDYTSDVREVLIRPIGETTLRSELEIEIMYKWIMQNHHKDTTGICHTIKSCKKKTEVVSALQHMRLECYQQGDAIIYQGQSPKAEDGQFTILSGECEVVQVQEDSVTLQRLNYSLKKKDWNSCKHILSRANVLATMKFPAGFGELSTLTDAKRVATIRVKSPLVEVVVTPKVPLIDCINAKRNKNGQLDEAEIGKVMDFLRQSGLANRISPSDLYEVGCSLKKRVLDKGEVLYLKGEPVDNLFLIVSGDILLDISDYRKNAGFMPFVGSTPNMCFTVGCHSILGDEGLVGIERVYEASAVILSTAAFVYEVNGFAKNYLSGRLEASRYAALAYKNLPKLTAPIQLAEQINIYSHLNSLRKTFSKSFPTRGSLEQYISDEANIAYDKGSQNNVHITHIGNKGMIVDKHHHRHQHIHDDLHAQDNIDAIDSESVVKSLSTTEGQEVRMLTHAALQHVILLYKHVKQREKAQVRINAQDNILADYLHAEEERLRNSLNGIELIRSEKLLVKTINQYQRQQEEKLKQIRENMVKVVDKEFSKAADARSLLSAMASAGVASAINDDAEAAADGQGKVDEAVINGCLEDALLTEKEEFLLALTKLQQYYHYLDQTNKLLEVNKTTDYRETSTKKGKKHNQKHTIFNTTTALPVPSKFDGKSPGALGIPWRPPSRPSSPVDHIVALSHSRVISRPNGMNLHLDHETLKKHQQMLQHQILNATTAVDNEGTNEDQMVADFAATTAEVIKEKVYKKPELKFCRMITPRTRRFIAFNTAKAIQNKLVSMGNDDASLETTAQKLALSSEFRILEDTNTFFQTVESLPFLERSKATNKSQFEWKTRFMRVTSNATEHRVDGCSDWLVQELLKVSEEVEKSKNNSSDVPFQNHVMAVNSDETYTQEYDAHNGEDESKTEHDVVIDDQVSHHSNQSNYTSKSHVSNNKQNTDNSVVAIAEDLNGILNTDADTKTNDTNANVQQPTSPKKNKEKGKWWIETNSSSVADLHLSKLDPPSPALNAYYEYTSAPVLSRKYLDGKRCAANNSKFQLEKDLKILLDLSQDKYDKKKTTSDDSSLSALLSCIGDPRHKLDQASEESLPHNNSMMKSSLGGKQQVDKYLRLKHEESNEIKQRFNEVILESLSGHEKAKHSKTINHDDSNSVNALRDWQQFSCKMAADNQSGERWTLPVLSNKTATAAGKAQPMSSAQCKWGRNLARIAPKKDFDVLAKPPTYLEVYQKYGKKLDKA